MLSNPPTPLPVPTLAVLWSQPLEGSPAAGLALGPRKRLALAWDANQCLYLLNQTGQVQGRAGWRRRSPSPAVPTTAPLSPLSAAGTALVAGPRSDRAVGAESAAGPVSAAVDPLGQYVVVSDVRGGLRMFDCYRRPLLETQSPRPFHHLAFVPAAAYLVGTADFGLVACLTLKGDWVWRDGLVIHVGSLAVTGTGDQIICACFTEALQRERDGRQVAAIFDR